MLCQCHGCANFSSSISESSKWIINHGLVCANFPSSISESSKWIINHGLVLIGSKLTIFPR